MAAVYPFRQPADLRQGADTKHGPSRFLDQPFSAPHYSAPGHTFNLQHRFRSEGLETHLAQFQATAQEKIFQAIGDFPEVKMDGWFIRHLDHKIIPALTRIGFDESLARVVFHTAAASWQRMGPLTNKCIWFHPYFSRSIKAIRNEMISKPGSNPVSFSPSGVGNPSDLRKSAGKIVDG